MRSANMHQTLVLHCNPGRRVNPQPPPLAGCQMFDKMLISGVDRTFLIRCDGASGMSVPSTTRKFLRFRANLFHLQWSMIFLYLQPYGVAMRTRFWKHESIHDQANQCCPIICRLLGPMSSCNDGWLTRRSSGKPPILLFQASSGSNLPMTCRDFHCKCLIF